MLFSDSYFTVESAVSATTREKGSKFIAFVFPVTTELEIKDQLVQLKKDHPSANHHCYAWRLGADKQAFRSNDDGEPANSAGKPIFSQIQSRDLTNVLIVVVRYFGGTLLGVGGLIAAYRLAASEALNQAKIIEKFILFEYRVTFDFEDVSSVMRVLKEFDAKIISNTFYEKNKVVFRIKKQNSENMEKKFKELYKTSLEFLNLI